MIRRRLFAYAVMEAAGIAAGFLIAERLALAAGPLVMLIAGMAVCMMMRASGSQDKRREYALECAALIGCMLAGFILFTASYISYERDVAKMGPDGSYILSEGIVHRITPQDEGYRITLSDAALIWNDGSSDPLTHDIQVMYKSSEQDAAELTGRKVRVSGTVREVTGADNPGCFDYRIYLRSTGTGTMIKAESIDLLPDDSRIRSVLGRWRRLIIRTRESYLSEYEDDRVRALMRGMVFGDKSEIDDELRSSFNINATGHILAVSGLHVGFMYGLLRMLTGKRRSLPVTIIIIAMIIVYGEMTMWSASTVRSVLVLSISLMSIYVRRPFDLLSSVSAAAVVIMTREPYQLLGSGFQLTFLALLGISFLSGPLSSMLGEGLGVTLSVQAGTAPLTACVFHRFNAASVLINIPVIGVASLLVPGCMLTLAVSVLAGSTPQPAVTLTADAAKLLIWMNELMAGDGGLSAGITSVNAGVLVLFYLVIILMASEWTRVMLLRKNYRLIGAAILSIIMVSAVIGIAAYNPFADDEVVFVAVGQGDCTHIRAGGRDVLIDGGGDTYRNVGTKVLMPYLLANGAERTELALVTHLHMDHYLGILQLSEEYPVGAVGIPADYRKSIENRRDADIEFPDRIEYIEQGSRIVLSRDVWIEPVWPIRGSKGDIEVDDPNENNMVYIVNYNGIRIMVTGDLLEQDELDMVSYYKGTDVLKCDILKVAHHGSKSSSSDAFLDAADPEIAVIQAGRNNIYGHPHQKTLDRLSERGIEVFRTDINGAVGIDIHGSRISVDVMK